MDWSGFLHITLSAVGLGAGGEIYRRYRAFKHARQTRPFAERNAGFWTDGRMIRAETAFASLAYGMPWTAITMMVATNANPYYSFAALITYPLVIFLFVSGLNTLAPPPLGRRSKRVDVQTSRPGGSYAR